MPLTNFSCFSSDGIDGFMKDFQRCKNAQAKHVYISCLPHNQKIYTRLSGAITGNEWYPMQPMVSEFKDYNWIATTNKGDIQKCNEYILRNFLIIYVP